MAWQPALVPKRDQGRAAFLPWDLKGTRAVQPALGTKRDIVQPTLVTKNVKGNRHWICLIGFLNFLGGPGLVLGLGFHNFTKSSLYMYSNITKIHYTQVLKQSSSKIIQSNN